jgi:hypothetical protein
MLNYHRHLFIVPLIASSLAMTHCAEIAEPGEKTIIASATGGAIGAGLGAIVGSQVGAPGAGVAIGGVAGAGAGFLIGEGLEKQERSIRSQDEILERQQRVIQAQKREIVELRGHTRDDDAPRAQMKVSAPRGTTVRSASSYPGLGYVPAQGNNVNEQEKRRIEEAYARARARAVRGEAVVAKVEPQEKERQAKSEVVRNVRKDISVARNATPPAPRIQKKQAVAVLSRAEREELEARETSRSIGSTLSSSESTLVVDPVAAANVEAAVGEEQSTKQAAVVENTATEKTKKVQVVAIPTAEEQTASASGLVEKSIPVAKVSVPEVAAKVTAPAADQQEEATSKGAYDWSVVEQKAETLGGSQQGGGAECARAAGEIENAAKARESADKLFHYRRALRLCPSSAEYHVLLGQAYHELNRPDDAMYEIREALKLDPALKKAQDLLALVSPRS